jgi:YVTN family beta-propeller protein
LVGTVVVGTQPFGVALSPDGSLLYAVNGNDTVSVIDTRTTAVVRTVSIDGAAETQWHSVAVSADGRQIYISDLADRTIRILTINTDTTSA